MESNDLWPVDIIDPTIRTPAKILKEQAAFLGPKTRNLVTAEIDTITLPYNRFMHIFYLVAPTLDNYRFELFRIEQRLKLYPVDFVLHEDFRQELALDSSHVIVTESEEEFVAMLKKVLSNSYTKGIINGILAQIPDYEVETDEDIQF